MNLLKLKEESGGETDWSVLERRDGGRLEAV